MEIPEGWTEQYNAISRKIECKDFAAALAFVNAVGALAESANHHPDISFGWGYAECTLTSHDAGAVTDKDLALAKQINELAAA